MTKNRAKAIDVILVTGMSGAGRSTATRALEDLGWFVTDNLPPTLFSDVVDYVASNADVQKVAVVADVRGGALFNELNSSLAQIKQDGHDVRVLFLEANNETLVRRYESSRRPHPLQSDGPILDAIERERALLSNLRAASDIIVDTSTLNVHDLRRRIEQAFGSDEHVALRVTVMSFGFKYGIPVDADFVADMRFLPNPFWDPELKHLTGLDEQVSNYVLEQVDALKFVELFTSTIDLVEDGYLREGKRYVTVAVGCTGGKHRSVAVAEHLAARLVKHNVEVRVDHRDLGRE